MLLLYHIYWFYCPNRLLIYIPLCFYFIDFGFHQLLRVL